VAAGVLPATSGAPDPYGSCVVFVLLNDIAAEISKPKSAEPDTPAPAAEVAATGLDQVTESADAHR
jgi:hypothetical protein